MQYYQPFSWASSWLQYAILPASLMGKQLVANMQYYQPLSWVPNHYDEVSNSSDDKNDV
jgi:hypothetical protein